MLKVNFLLIDCNVVLNITFLYSYLIKYHALNFKYLVFQLSQNQTPPKTPCLY